ncbi:unnamed protein product, partial [Iphiclides podalirius]
MYTISQLSPKSIMSEKLALDDVLQTTQTENLSFRIEPSAKYNLDIDIEPEDVLKEEEIENHIIVARSADPNDRESRSINNEDIPTSNHNED